MSGPDTYRIGVLDNTYSVLRALAERPRTASELSAELDLRWNTVYRIVRNLEHKGVLAQLDGKRFGLRFAFLHGLQHIHGIKVRDTARPLLAQLASKTGETAYLTMREGLQAVCVDRVESPHPLQLLIKIGDTQPLGVGAVGKLLLAYAPEEIANQLFANKLPAVTANTITDSGELRAEIERIRATGIALSAGENTTGVAAIAAPVFAQGGDLIAALSVGGPTTRITGNPARELQASVRQSAKRLGIVLSNTTHTEN